MRPPMLGPFKKINKKGPGDEYIDLAPSNNTKNKKKSRANKATSRCPWDCLRVKEHVDSLKQIRWEDQFSYIIYIANDLALRGKDTLDSFKHFDVSKKI